MHFADLWMLWIFGPLAVLWTGLLIRNMRRGSANRASRSSAIRFSSLHLLRRLKPSGAIGWRRVVIASRAIVLILLVTAMARPQHGRKHSKVVTEGIDIMLAIDTSGSMQALDLDGKVRISSRRNRLAVVKTVVNDFVEKREFDQIGMVVFGSEAFTQCPLTLDHGVVSTFLERLSIGMAGEQTSIGDAIGTSVKRLKDSAAKSKVIILLTDGRHNQGTLTPIKAAEIAQTFGIKIYTIAAGTRGKAPFMVDDFFGKRVQYEDVQIDEKTLEAVASTTGGAYFRAEDADALKKIYERIDALETTEIETHSYMEYDERFGLFVIPALALLLLEVLLLSTRLRKIP